MSGLVPAGTHPATGLPVIPAIASAAGSAPRFVTVRFDRVYGLIKCYPVDRAALLVAELTGTKTLSPADLLAVRRLGFDIWLADGSRELLERFLGETS